MTRLDRLHSAHITKILLEAANLRSGLTYWDNIHAMNTSAQLPTDSRSDDKFPRPEVWIKKTALSFSARSPSTIEMDASYENYFRAIKKPNEVEAARALYNTMSVYLQEKGGMWSKCERNRVSNGLLARVYDELKRKIGAVGENVASTGRIESVDVPHARFGVLYLLASVSVELGARNYAAMALEGVQVLGTSAALGGTFNIKANDPSNVKGGNAVFSAMGKRMASQTVGLGKLGTQSVSTLISTAGGALTIGSGMISTDATDLPSHLQIHHNAMAGSVVKSHSERHREYSRHLQGIPLAVPASFKNHEQSSQAFVMLWRTISNKVGEVVATLRTKMLANGDWPFSLTGPTLKAIVVKGISMIFSAAAPYVDATISLLSDITKTISAVIQKINVYKLRKQFELREGHPEALAKSIEREMKWLIGAGSKDMMKDAAGLASQVVLPGAGSLVSAVMSAIEWLVKSIMRIAEAFRIKEFLDEAHELFQKEPRTGGSDAEGFAPAGKERGGIVHNTERFAEFFRKGCRASPIIPMLTLNTGICGNLMIMIRMVNDFNQTSSSSFDAGAAYFRQLKQFGAAYMQDSGFSFLPRGQGEMIALKGAAAAHQKAVVSNIHGLLNHALNSHPGHSTVGSKISAMLTSTGSGLAGTGLQLWS